MREVALFFMVITILPFSQSKKGWDDSVCTLPSITQNDTVHKRPNLPKQFSVRIEANMVDKNYTTDIREWYDGPHNRGALEQWEGGLKLNAIYDYDVNELILVMPFGDSGSKCGFTDLDKDPNKFIFGVKKSVNGTDKIFSAAGALRFGGTLPEKYMGVERVKGIFTDTWKSCVYWDDMDATMIVTWHFTRPDWQTSLDISQVPVRCHVTGKIWNGTKPREIDHIYDFYEFKQSLDDHDAEKFETPPGTYCKGMKSRKHPPVPPNEFSFGAEIMFPSTNKITYVKERYDHTNKLAKIEYKPSNFDAGVSKDKTTEVHDFNTGVVYSIDDYRHTCSVTPLSAFDISGEKTRDGTIRMRSSSEFFYTNTTKPMEYEGVRKMRGIDCDVWVTTNNKWPVGKPTNTTWEWYFATNAWLSSAGVSGMPNMIMPIGAYITFATSPADNMVYNFYDYDATSGNRWEYDVSACYNDTQKQVIQFLLEGNFTEDVLSEEVMFKNLIRNQVEATTGVLPLRISYLNLDHNDKYILVTFTMLGPAPVKGDVEGIPDEPSLNTAVTTLTNMLTKGVVVVDIFIGGKFVSLHAVPYSDTLWGYKPITQRPFITSQPDDEPEVMKKTEVETFEEAEVEDPESRIYKRSANDKGVTNSGRGYCENTSQGFSSGDVAAIAIGMLALGFLICFSAILLGSKYRNSRIKSDGYEQELN